MLIVGRHHGQAPEIDGQVMINDTGNLALHEGKFVNVEITQVLDYDLVATVLPTQH
jgi:ribosomal protein S12 methylthiotransferase